MAQKNIRWGILGLGKVARMFGEGISQVKGADLHAIASRDPKRGEQYAKKFRSAKVYSSYEDLLSDPEIDVVYVATPHRFHHQQTKLCLEAGKHVLCEKPITVNSTEAEQLFTLAKQNNLFLMEAMWTPFLPIYQQVRQWLNDGKIGDVKLISSSFGIPMQRDLNSRIFNPELAAGVLLDMGIYNLAMSRWVAQQGVSSFEVTGLIGETGIDELVVGFLNFDGGIVAQFSCNLLTRTPNDLSIYGTEGHIQVLPVFWAASKAILVTADQKKTVKKSFKGSGFEFEIGEVCRCITEGLLESPLMPHQQSLATIRLMDAMREQMGVKYHFE